MTDKLKEIQADVYELGWEDLEPHHKREVLIMVSTPELLLDVAAAIAGDKVDSIATWLSQGVIHKTSDQDTESIEQYRTSFFRFVIVSPFVIACPIPAPAANPIGDRTN